MLSNLGGLACSGSGHALGESDAVFGPINTGFKDGSVYASVRWRHGVCVGSRVAMFHDFPHLSDSNVQP